MGPSDRLPWRGAILLAAFAAYAATATPGAFWLDSSELAAAGVTLGVAHPPGHPLYVLLAHAASLVPLGTVDFRVALLSAALGTWAAALAFDVARLLARRAFGDEAPAWPAALAGLVVAASEAVWLQAVRAEVYTLHLALALWLVREALRWAASAAPRPAAPPLAAAFVVGLGAGNHHLLLAALVPALAVLLAVEPRALARRLPALALAAAAGLAVYVALPLRALTDPLVSYGDPRTLGRLLDVVTARVFQRSITEAAAPLADNLGAATEMLAGDVGPLLLLAAPVGLLALARRAPAAAAAVALAVAGNLATKVFMVLDPKNPDAAGYFQTSVALTAAAGALVLAGLALRRDAASRVLTAAVAALALAPPLALAAARLDRVDLSRVRAPALVDTWLTAPAAPGGVLMTAFYALHFQRLHAAAATGYRADLTAFHQGFEAHVAGGAPLVRDLRRRDPGLEPVLAAFEREGAFPTDAVVALSARRALYLEPTLALPVPPEARVPAGALVRVAPPPAPSLPLGDPLADLLRVAGPELRGQREGRRTVVLLGLELAVTALQAGDAAGALRTLAAVEGLSPGSPYVDRLEPVARALAAAQAAGGPGEAARARERVRALDFRGLFEAAGGR